MDGETVEVPFIRVGNRQALTAKQLVDEPWLQRFVDRFPNSFEYDPTRDIWLLDGVFLTAPCPT